MGEKKGEKDVMRKENFFVGENCFGARLTTISVQVSAGCNRACPFCPSKKYEKFVEFEGQRGIREEVLSKLADFVNFYSEFNVGVTFGWIDEPYVFNGFENRIKYLRERIRKKNICLSVATNGDLLTEDRIVRSFDSGINYIQITHYDEDCFDEKIRYFKEICVKRQIVFHERSNNFISGYLSVGKRDLLILPGWKPPVFGGWNNRAGIINNRLTVASSKVSLYSDIDDNEGWLLDKKRYKNKLRNNNNLPLSKMCVMPFRRLVLYMNGEIGLCCNDFYGGVIVGNIMNQCIKEAWELSRVMNYYRKNLLHKKRRGLKLCESCNYYGGGYLWPIYKRAGIRE